MYAKANKRSNRLVARFEFRSHIAHIQFTQIVDVCGIPILCTWDCTAISCAEFRLYNIWPALQGGEDLWDALCCRSFFAKEPLILGLFCGKWPVQIRHPMGLCHPVHDVCVCVMWVSYMYEWYALHEPQKIIYICICRTSEDHIHMSMIFWCSCKALYHIHIYVIFWCLCNTYHSLCNTYVIRIICIWYVLHIIVYVIRM